jgi:hypothetical protein
LLNIDAILCGVDACDLLSGLFVQILETELGTLPELDLILKMDQKRLGLIFNVLPKDWKNDSLLSLIAFLT